MNSYKGRKEDGVDEFTDGFSGLNCSEKLQKADLTCDEKAEQATQEKTKRTELSLLLWLLFVQLYYYR